MDRDARESERGNQWEGEGVVGGGDGWHLLAPRQPITPRAEVQGAHGQLTHATPVRPPAIQAHAERGCVEVVVVVGRGGGRVGGGEEVCCGHVAGLAVPVPHPLSYRRVGAERLGAQTRGVSPVPESTFLLSFFLQQSSTMGPSHSLGGGREDQRSRKRGTYQLTPVLTPGLHA